MEKSLDGLLQYKVNEPVTVDEYIEVLRSSGLSARRPVHDLSCMSG